MKIDIITYVQYNSYIGNKYRFVTTQIPLSFIKPQCKYKIRICFILTIDELITFRGHISDRIFKRKEISHSKEDKKHLNN